MVNFIVILCDETTDTSITEQEVAYVFFVDPDTMEPTLNSGKKSGLISLFRAEKDWVTFIWCFSHHLELALKETLKNSIARVDESLMHLYCLPKHTENEKNCIS